MPPKEIDEDLVRYLAGLARLELASEEASIYARQLTEIVRYVEQLSAVDTEGAQAMTHVLDVVNVTRPDEPQPSASREEVLANAPDQADGCFRVPRVV